MRALTGLRVLVCAGGEKNTGRLVDLKPLQGLKLTRLDIHNTGVGDLSPLAGMPLEDLRCSFCPIVDLEPLREAPLTDHPHAFPGDAMTRKYETLDEYLDDLDAIKEKVADKTSGMTTAEVVAYFADAQRRLCEHTGKKNRTRRRKRRVSAKAGGISPAP